MTYKTKLVWIVSGSLKSGFPKYEVGPGKLFNVRTGKSILGEIGGDIASDFFPLVLEPTKEMHDALGRIKDQTGLQGKKFPFFGRINLAPAHLSDELRINVNIHLYGSELFIIFDVAESDFAEETDFEWLERFENQKPLVVLATRLFSAISSGDKYSETWCDAPKMYPCIKVVSSAASAELSRERLASILSRHSHVKASVAEKIFSKNDRHQIDRTSLLIDRQGVVSYIPATASDRERAGNGRRFRSAVAMLEMAAAISRNLDNANASAEGQHDEQLLSKLSRLIPRHDVAIPNSMSAQLVWNLLVDEFSLKSKFGLLLESKGRLLSLESVSPSANRVSAKDEVVEAVLLLVTVAQVETRAVLEVFESVTNTKPKAVPIGGRRYQDLGTLAATRVYLAISEMGTGGLGGSQEAVRIAIADCKPSAVIMVGIAFGVDQKKQKIGDVLVSTQLMLYDLQRVGTGQIVPRADKPHASPALINWFSHALLLWDDSKSTVRTGLVLSGDKLVDNIDYRDSLKQLAHEAIGGEMEGAGLYVACQNAKVDWILVKSICDWADGRKATNKSARQKLAARNAAKLVCDAIRSGYGA